MKHIFLCALVLTNGGTGEIQLYLRCALKEDASGALDETQKLAQISVGPGSWNVSQSAIRELDRDLLEEAARDILGWEPPALLLELGPESGHS